MAPDDRKRIDEFSHAMGELTKGINNLEKQMSAVFRKFDSRDKAIDKKISRQSKCFNAKIDGMRKDLGDKMDHSTHAINLLIGQKGVVDRLTENHGEMKIEQKDMKDDIKVLNAEKNISKGMVAGVGLVAGFFAAILTIAYNWMTR